MSLRWISKAKITKSRMVIKFEHLRHYPQGLKCIRLCGNVCLLSPQNLIAQSQSGTGKTAAFSLAMLSHVNPSNKWTQVSWTCWRTLQYGCRGSWDHKFTIYLLARLNDYFWVSQCLCIAPTYELAVQIGQVIEQMGKFYPEVKLSYAIRGNRGKNFVTLITLKIDNGTLHFRPVSTDLWIKKRLNIQELIICSIKLFNMSHLGIYK